MEMDDFDELDDPTGDTSVVLSDGVLDDPYEGGAKLVEYPDALGDELLLIVAVLDA